MIAAVRRHPLVTILIATSIVGAGFWFLVYNLGLAFADPVVQSPSTELPPGFWEKLFSAATSGEWKWLAGLVLVGTTFGLRKWGLGWVPKLGPWLKTRWGGRTLAALTALVTTVGLAWAAKQTVNVGLLLEALGTALAGNGLYDAIKEAKKPG